ncbi:hypothetical protein [Shewanella cyperi]|uniref:hypothetical protein n=1 Tax=Shewanella cyperi TaxID=2814292 RepID=UPI001A946AC1|nr:hypothetical protein [Shewanella cyperi]QSX41366.1 hypothetical protein JYB84_02710 [Shewanella cyperi]
MEATGCTVLVAEFYPEGRLFAVLQDLWLALVLFKCIKNVNKWLLLFLCIFNAAVPCDAMPGKRAQSEARAQ